jgi:hypothetical protein
MAYILRCGWCGAILNTQESPGANDEPDRVTHTICRSCRAVVMAELQQTKDRTPGWWHVP